MLNINEVRTEKEALQVKVLTTEEQVRNLYDRVRVTDGLQKAYEELRRTQQVVEQQERLRALGQMSSGVAHDVNNALSPIVAYAGLLQATLPDLPEASRNHLKIIAQAADDISRIVSRMREFNRRRSDPSRWSGWTSMRSFMKWLNSPARAGATFPSAKASPSRFKPNWSQNCRCWQATPANYGKP